MEYKGERETLKEWAVKMDSSDKLESYISTHFVPPNMNNI